MKGSRCSGVLRNLWPLNCNIRNRDPASQPQRLTTDSFEAHHRVGAQIAAGWHDGTKLCEGKSLIQAVDDLTLLVHRGAFVSHAVFYSVLKRCIAEKSLLLGRRLHALVVRSGYESNDFLANHIICMYASHGKLVEASQAFYKVNEPSRFMWASIISAHCRQGHPAFAIALYRSMRSSTVKADTHIFVAVLKACATAKDLMSGKEVHADILQTVEKHNIFVGTCLVDMYSKCGSLEDARKVFESLPTRDEVLWTAMIGAYARRGLGQQALSLYSRMQQNDIGSLDAVTYVCLLQACSSAAALEGGKRIHAEILRSRQHDSNVTVVNALIDMYAKCGSLIDARRVFDSALKKDVVTWTTMIAGYAQGGLGEEAIRLYSSMKAGGTTPADSVTFVCLLQACTSIGAFHDGKQFHEEIKERGLESDRAVGNCLINMYAKCGSLQEARRVFNSLPTKDVVTWNSMLAGYAQHGLGWEALSLYESMRETGIAVASAATFVSLLQACGSVAELEKGKEIHTEVVRHGLETSDVKMGNALVDMYSKCGNMHDARQVFDSLHARDVVTWNALITGYARQGKSDVVFDLFEKMKQEGIQPDSVTFLSVLTTSSHVGLVDRGKRYFQAMQGFDIPPTMEHYNCMVDLLGRAGELDRAMEVVTSMPFEPDIEVWRCLLSACQKWRNVGVGRRAFDRAVKLYRSDAAVYVLMSNIYSAAHMWEEAQEIQAKRVKAHAVKKPGLTWCVDTDGSLREFAVGEENPGRTSS